MLQRDLVLQSATAQPAMVSSLGKLEAAGLIARTPNTTDRRAAIITLTEAGCRVVAAAKALLIEANRRALAGFTHDEAALCMMRRLIGNLAADD